PRARERGRGRLHRRESDAHARRAPAPRHRAPRRRLGEHARRRRLARGMAVWHAKVGRADAARALGPARRRRTARRAAARCRPARDHAAVSAARFRRFISAPLAAGALAACLLAAAPAARAETWVSFPTLLHEVRSGDLIRAIINPARHDIEIKFRNLSEWHAYYPAGEQSELQRLLDARHV